MNLFHDIVLISFPSQQYKYLLLQNLVNIIYFLTHKYFIMHMARVLYLFTFFLVEIYIQWNKQIWNIALNETKVYTCATRINKIQTINITLESSFNAPSQSITVPFPPQCLAYSRTP